MRTKESLVLALGAALFVGGIVLHTWYASYAGALLLAGSGRWAIALVFACILDLMYGAPVGALHALKFPFTLLTLAVVLARAYLVRHIR